MKIEGVDKQKYREFIPIDIDAETHQRFLDTPDGALLGKDFVRRYKNEYPWKVGETYKLKQLKGMSIKFVGAYESSNEVYNGLILAGRRYLQEVDDQLGVAHQVFIKLDDPKHAGQVIATLDEELPKQFPFKTQTKDQKSFISDAVEDLRAIVGISRWIMLITLGVVLVSVANTVSMATRDRVQEFGIVRSVGFRRIQILGLVLGESMLLGLLGGGLGILAAWALLNVQDYHYGVQGINLLIRVTPTVVVTALGLSLLVGIFGGLAPASGASRLKIVNSLRNVD